MNDKEGGPDDPGLETNRVMGGENLGTNLQGGGPVGRVL